MWYKLAFKCFCLYVECRFYSWKTGLYAKFFHVLYKLGEWCVENSEEDYAHRPTLIEQTIEAWEWYRKLRAGSLEFRALAETSYVEMKKSFCLSLISKESSRNFLGLFFLFAIFSTSFMKCNFVKGGEMKKYKHAISSFYYATAAKFWARYGSVFKDPNAFNKAYRHLVSAEVELLEFKFQSMK